MPHAKAAFATRSYAIDGENCMFLCVGSAMSPMSLYNGSGGGDIGRCHIFAWMYPSQLNEVDDSAGNDTQNNHAKMVAPRETVSLMWKAAVICIEGRNRCRYHWVDSIIESGGADDAKNCG